MLISLVIGGHGTWKIPSTEPVLFVCAPHANQFLDPVIVMQCVNRRIGFLTAAKSMRRKFIGAYARAMGSIPVERIQDVTEKGTGKVKIQGKLAEGIGTKFTKQLQPGRQALTSRSRNSFYLLLLLD